MNEITDFRRKQRTQSAVDAALRQSFDTFRASMIEQMAAMNAELAAVVAAQGQLLAKQQLIIDDLAKTLKPTLLGDTSVTVSGSLVAITLAGTRRWVNAFAGVKPGDYLQPVMSEYLPDGWGLPQLTCRNAGQIEIRIAVPQLAIGASGKDRLVRRSGASHGPADLTTPRADRCPPSFHRGTSA